MIRVLPLASLIGFALVTAPAQAEEPPRENGADVVSLNGEHGSSGAITINAAAGANNQQANLGIIANGDIALATGVLVQQNNSPSNEKARPASAEIADGAFSGTHGWHAINVAAGSDNQQANLAIMAIGIEGQVLTETILGQTRASPEPIGETAESVPPDRSARIGDGAFENSSGLIQLNVVGGERNSSANVFALSVSTSAGE